MGVFRLALLPWIIALALYVNCSPLALVPFDQLGTYSLYLPGPPAPEGQGHHIAKRSVYGNGDLTITNFNVQVDIKYRYSCMYFTSTVIIKADGSQEVRFQVVLPETGFISKFVMEIDGRTYEAYVKQKEEAKNIYDRAQSNGQTAGLVELNSRHSNVFNVNVNVHSWSSVTFNLTYEELLERRLGRYEQIINISPSQGYTIDNLAIAVTIEEPSQIKNIVIPKLKFDEHEYGNEDVAGTNPGAEVVLPASNRARIIWKPGKSDLDELKKQGAIGKFIVRYELEQESGAGDVLVMNGYFVHFFSPPNLKPLIKHVVFVLDFSGSMLGRKIEQLKEAEKKILNDLKSDDYFNVIIFSSELTHWTPGSTYVDPWRSFRSRHFYAPARGFDEMPFDESPRVQPYAASRENIRATEDFIVSLPANGGTNIHEALQEGVRVAHSMNDRENLLPKDMQSMILFLTDGEPTVGVTALNQIERNIRNANKELGTPIFSLAFGQEADFPFIKRVSLQNHGFARKIYEAADAKLQLEGYYKEISSPLLRDVRFKYSDDQIEDVTTITFSTLFGGREIVTAGRIRTNEIRPSSDQKLKQASAVAPSRAVIVDILPRCFDCDACLFPVEIYGCGRGGACRVWKRPMIYTYRRWSWRCWRPPPITTTLATLPPPTKEDYFLERFWAYLTIKQLIDQDFAESDGVRMSTGGSSSSVQDRALQLALKYGFVTSLTSLVVVKPEEEYIAEPVPIDYYAANRGFGGGGAPMASMMRMGAVRPHFMNGGNKMQFAVAPESAAAAWGMGDFGDFVDISKRIDKAGPTIWTRPSMTTVRAPVATTETTKTPSTNDTSEHLGLDDIKWLQKQGSGPLSLKIERGSGKTVNYEVARGNTKAKELELQKFSCVILYGAIKHGGQCLHLKDCVQQEFIDDFDRYQRSYFCQAVTKRARNTTPVPVVRCEDESRPNLLKLKNILFKTSSNFFFDAF